MINGRITAAPPGWNIAAEVMDNHVPHFVSRSISTPPPANVWCGVVSWFMRIYTSGRSPNILLSAI